VYEVVGPLGHGGMGEVYKARDTRLNRIVAIKVLTAAGLDRPQARARFQREALAIAALNHPHICTLHDIGHDQGHDFIVMEYVEGETLSLRLDNGPLPLPEALAYAREISRAIDTAHRRGVIHRDLKPANIMLTKSGAKLLDFGLAKLREGPHAVPGGDNPTRTDDISGEGTVVGTLRYMAPEVLRGKEADARSDVFSFGAVVYEMVTGAPPFNGVGDARVIAAILSDEPRRMLELRPDAPQALDWIVRTCLAKDPDERWQDAREVVRQLNLLDPAQVGSPMTPTPTPRVQRPRAPSSMWALAGAAALIAVTFAVVMFRPIAGARLPASANRDPLVAPHVVVLPCKPAGDVTDADRAQCDGLGATLTSKLSQLTTVHALQVTPASDVHGRGIASPDAARRQLGATFAVESTLRRSGAGVDFIYALVETHTARTLDTLTLSAAADALAAQERLTVWVVDTLRLRVAAPERARLTANGTQARDAYAFSLQGFGYLLEYQRPGAIDVAIGLFNKAFEIDPKYALAHAGLGQAYWVKYEASKDEPLVEAARSACRQALNLGPDLAAAYLCAGTVHSGTGEYEQAITFFERALQIDPASDDAYRRLARAQELLGRFEAAQQTYLQAVALRRHYWATHVWLANFHRSRGNYTEAAQSYEQAVALTPDNAPVRGILAGMYMFLGRYDDALREAKASIDLWPTYITHVTLGMTYYRMRRFDDAVASLETARGLLEDFRTLGNLGRAYFWSGRPEQARTLFTEAVRLGEREISINPRNDEVHVALADYYARLGRRDEALAHLSRARLDNPHFMFFAAMVHAELGDASSARGWLEKAVEAGLPPAELTAWIDLDKVQQPQGARSGGPK
jgi:tetratricopeptide (TPR) repeat protein